MAAVCFVNGSELRVRRAGRATALRDPVESFPSNDALHPVRELWLGGDGYKVSRFVYSDDEAGCSVEVTWRNDATRDQVTYLFHGVVAENLWPVQGAGMVEIVSMWLRQWDTPRPLQVGFGELDKQFYASSVERIQRPATRPRGWPAAAADSLCTGSTGRSIMRPIRRP